MVLLLAGLIVLCIFTYHRFSLLLLEPGEIYFEDFSAFCCDGDVIPANGIPKLDTKGRLKICSKSIIYDPKDHKLPILKFLYRDVLDISKWKSKNSFQYAGECVSVEVDQHVEMKENNVIAPYQFQRGRKKFVMTLEFCSTDDCIPQMCQLLRASTLPIADQTAMINAIVLHRQQLIKFDTSWLGSLYEKSVYETQADRITPLVTNPGRVMLTSEQLYFQAFNNVDPVPVIRVKLAHIKSLVKRRFCLRSIGLELYCREGSSIQHLYLSFRSQTDRDEMFDYILAQENTKLDDLQQQNLTIQWQNGAISNFDYLMHLNSLADRSLNDLTQYPVFPWVIQNYTSNELDLTDPENFRDLTKPIGALNEERLNKLLERFEDMPGQKFLYGSHYSTPGYILFYLVRIAPEYMLCLQNGRFDQPDRMFNSLKDAWNNCLTSYSDFKELIPEFYDGEGEFLKNSKNILFGVRADGSPVEDVALPPWAEDAADMVHKLRDALESDHVSKHLHHWIDLVFGYKQQGEEAERAHNLFYYLTYEGAVDIEQYTDLNERVALEQQIMEFGQTPKQLFTTPHPCKLSKTDQATLSIPNKTESANNQPEGNTNTEELTKCSAKTDPWMTLETDLEQGAIICEYSVHRGSVTCVQWDQAGQVLYSLDSEGFMKLYSVISGKQLQSVNVLNSALNSLLVLDDQKTVMIGGCDNNLYLYSLEYGRELGSYYAHDDSVTCLEQVPEPGVKGKNKTGGRVNVLSGSSDCTVKMWQCSGKPGYQLLPLGELDHDAEVTCMSTSEDASRVAVGTSDGAITTWDLGNQSAITRFQAHDGALHDVKLNQGGTRVLSSGEDGVIKVSDVTSGAPVLSKYTDNAARCLDWNEAKVLAGGDSGNLEVWDLYNTNSVLAKRKVHDGSIRSVAMHQSGMLASGGTDMKVSVLDLNKHLYVQ